MDSTWLESTVAQTEEVAGWVRDADPSAPVPTCPGWTLTGLIEHIGATQRWVSRLVDESVTDPAEAFGIAWEVAPADSADWSGWLLDGANHARAVFDDATDERPVFDPSGGGDGVTFWSRRLFGEISVHRIDVAFALDRPYEIRETAAAAAIDDWLGNMASSGWAANVPGFADAMRGNGQTIAWVADDAGQAWLLQRTEAPLVLRHDLSNTADVTIQGPARELLQIVSRRLPLNASEASTVTGNRAELDHLLANMTWVGAP